MDAGRSAAFSVLFVCTANQCRSHWLNSLSPVRSGRLGWTGPWAQPGFVPSPGTPSRSPGGPHPDRQGEDLTGWISRRVDRSLISTQDLILVMTQEHRAELGMLDPSALPRTHLLLNFAAQTGELNRAGPERGAAGT